MIQKKYLLVKHHSRCCSYKVIFTSLMLMCILSYLDLMESQKLALKGKTFALLFAAKRQKKLQALLFLGSHITQLTSLIV